MTIVTTAALPTSKLASKLASNLGLGRLQLHLSPRHHAEQSRCGQNVPKQLLGTQTAAVGRRHAPRRCVRVRACRHVLESRGGGGAAAEGCERCLAKGKK